jgi:hypothetical protein
MNSGFEQHLTDEQLVEVYYGELDASDHLPVCERCRNEFLRLREVLDAVGQCPIPERGPEYGREVWNRLLPQLPPDRPRHLWLNPIRFRRMSLRTWLIAPAMAALLALVFWTGRITDRSGVAPIADRTRERVLLMSLGDHLAQAQIVLASVANAAAGDSDQPDERDRAHELLGANRLLRQTAARLGDTADAALLEELERVLLAVANSPGHFAGEDLARTQQQIGKEGLLFRVRVSSLASRERGEKL